MTKIKKVIPKYRKRSKRDVAKDRWQEKDITAFIICKKCSEEFHCKSYSEGNRTGYCDTCRPTYYANWWKTYGRAYFESLPAKKRRLYAKKRYEVWKAWAEKKKERRRELARLSYHRRKAANRQKRNKRRRDYYQKHGR